jgi:hypothetical protein
MRKSKIQSMAENFISGSQRSSERAYIKKKIQKIRNSLSPGDIGDFIRRSSIASFDPATQDIGLLPEIIRNSKTSNDLDVRQKRTEERN